ncbi:PASTA domain-containing protein [Paenibacillus alba]|uniref:PASTA domain-containing protein n=1 Tax=Paenibacillus alba TaxID=1197127 RepID=A0ABU6GCS5_9BACL|nr:PASTA domain-containing protein [Paenibacillus alba]MEC0231057.1 PASTA domain-containing protein [Paenibacillus alba]
MQNKIGTRYMPGAPIRSLPQGKLTYGDDTFLTRKVLLYQIELSAGLSGVDYIRKLNHKAAFIHDGFQHILDTSVDEASVTIILQAKPGSLFSQRMKGWTYPHIVTLIADLGVSLLDAMEERITGFSVDPENLWLSDHDKLSVINYWDVGNPQNQGAVGLCRLMIQLFTGTDTIPGAFEVMHTHLERASIPSATYEQKMALIRLVKLVCQGQASLSSLIFGLRSLPSSAHQQDSEPIHSEIAHPNQSVDKPQDDEPMETAETRSNRKPEQSASWLRKAALGAVTLFVVVLIIVWALWPANKPSQPVEAPPTQTDTKQLPPTATPVASPTPKLRGDSTKQAEEVVIPNLIGLSQEDAHQQMLAAGLHYEFFIEASDLPKGTVIRQDPPAGTKGLEGDNVTFWLSKGNN